MFWRIPNLLGDGPLEFILDKESFTLEELLDEEEIIQECKALNSRLINFLRDRSQVEQLLQYIIDDAPNDADNKRTFKFPFIACEIFTCEIDVILKTLVEDEELMNRLFSFLEPERTHNPTLAGYFSKVVVCLMLRKTTSLMTYVQTHEAIFPRLVDLIGITSIMEILIRLVGADDHTYTNYMDIMQWLANTNLLEMIVDKLSPSHSSEINANAAEVLMTIIRNAPSALAAKLSSQSFVGKIFSHALEKSSSKSALVHTLSVCIALLDPKRSASTAYHYIRSQHFYESYSHVDPGTVHAMLTELNDLLKLLDVSCDANTTLPTTYGELHPPLGKHRLKIVEFIAVLLEVGDEAAGKELILSGAIHTILDLFFKYPFNNTLHHHVENLVISCIGSKSTAIVDHLFSDCGIIDKFLQADNNPFLSGDTNAVTIPVFGRHPIRAGNIGHITRICNRLVQLCNGNAYIRSHLQKSTDWVDWQTSVLRERNAVENVSHWACGRPTSLHESTRDSDEELHDRDFDTAASTNNSSQAFHYRVYENDEMDEEKLQNLYLDEGSDEVISCLHPVGDNRSYAFTNSNWFAFEDESTTEPMSITTLDRVGDLNLNETSSSGDGSDDEVVVGIEGLTKNVTPESNCTSHSSAMFDNTSKTDDSVIELSTDTMKLNISDVSLFQFDTTENEDLFNDQQQPDWVGWREASDIQVDGSPDLSTQSYSEGTAVATAPVAAVESAGDYATVGASASTDLAKAEEYAPTLFEEDAEFVGVDLAASRGTNAEVDATKRNFVLSVSEPPEAGEGGTMLEFSKSHWRVESEVFQGFTDLAKAEEYAPTLFEEDAEFVGVDLAASRGTNAEVDATKRNFVLSVSEPPEAGEGGTMLEFSKSHWRVESEVGVVQE